MAEESKGLRPYDLQVNADPGRRSLPHYVTIQTSDRVSNVRQSTPDMSLKNRASLNVERNTSNNNGVWSKDINYKGKYFPDLNNFRMSFGTPSYPSPLDRIRSSNQGNNASFEANQSFPKTSKTKLKVPTRKLHLDNFKGSELNDVSFSSGFPKGAYNHLADRSFDQSPLDKSMNQSGHSSSREVSHISSREVSHISSKDSSMNASSGERSMADSWSFYNHIGGCDVGNTLPSTVRNPNKALCTINGKTSEVNAVDNQTIQSRLNDILKHYDPMFSESIGKVN
ncbi:uncharacterized protein LOC128549335 [Mercenaria mercenaria]|uniref:uncharacterized protein LOC128549335 n=1 Tax=Mercenaria mercenaria TaxID=6596 RepID=UPI00234E8144|nr:uncharacterized protein LOC128549335 [Mercenaria mercenaria]